MASVVRTEVSKEIVTEEPLCRMDIPEKAEDKTVEVEIPFEDAFQAIDRVISIGGLGGLYKRDTVFTTFNKLLYIVGLVNIVISMIGEFLILVLFFISDEYTILMTAEMLPCLITSVFSVIKSFLIIFKREEICSVVLDLRELWPKIKVDSVNKIVRENMISAKTFCQIFMYATMNVAMVYSAIPIAKFLYYEIIPHEHSYKWNEIVSLPFILWYPYDYKKAVWKYILTLLSQLYAGIFTTVLVGGVDCFFCLLMAHVTMHFLLLQRRIRNLNMPHDDVTLEEAEKSVKEEINEIVEYHNQLHTVTTKIQDIFSSVLFFNLAISSLTICLELFCLTVAPRGLVIKNVVFIASPLLEISLKCYYGNRLIEESTAVRDAAYDSGWVDSRALRSLVLMLQIRAEKPAEISAMGFTNASLATFTSIIRASWSYFTLLHNVYDDINL